MARRQLVADLDPLAGLDGAAAFADLGADAVELLVDVDAVEDRLLLAVLGDDVVVEVRERGRRRGGGQPDDGCVEVVDDLAPAAVDGAVALVDPDEVEELDGQLRVVGDLDRAPLGGELEAGGLVELLVQRAVGSPRSIEYRRWMVQMRTLADFSDVVRAQHLHAEEVAEAPAVIGGDERQELGQGLVAQRLTRSTMNRTRLALAKFSSR